MMGAGIDAARDGALEHAIEELMAATLAAERDALRAEVERLRSACSRENDIISQTLGRALEYPRFADDQKNFPGATDADGVCVGDHVAASLADEAANVIRTLRSENAALANVLYLNGFQRCDVTACNCGSWHHRFGLPERMAEIKDALADAGHPLSNNNGNKPLNALAELVSERDEMNAALRDCLLLASRHRHEEWAQHVMRFCARGGVVPSPMRGE